MTTETFTIRGQVSPGAFLPWIERHARRIGVRVRILTEAPEAIALDVAGHPALLDAMEMGCLLGPREVWVDRIDRAPRNDNISI